MRAIIAAALLAMATSARAAEPVAAYRFAGGLPAAAEHGAPALALVGTPRAASGGMALVGADGLRIGPDPRLAAGSGFGVEMVVRFDAVGVNYNLANRAGEYLIRTDPTREGGCISFFVNANNYLEPRVRGPVARTGVDYRISATWNGSEAVLWVNGVRYSQPRPGVIVPTGAPVLLGGPSEWAAGMRGVIREAAFFNAPLSEGAIFARRYGLSEIGRPGEVRSAAFDFAAHSGWNARGPGAWSAGPGGLRGRVAGQESLILRTDLDLPAAPDTVIGLRMTARRGATARVLLQTTAGLGAATVKLVADGRPHSYTIPADPIPEFDGRLTGIALAPSDCSDDVALHRLTVGPAPRIAPELTIRDFVTGPVIVRARRRFQVGATLANGGGAGACLAATLAPGPGARVVGAADRRVAALAAGASVCLAWTVEAERAGPLSLTLRASGGGATPAARTTRVPVLAAQPVRRAAYVPEPIPAASPFLIGAHYCPLWKQGARSGGWQEILPYPDRKPALGWFDEENPEVTDWDIKWATEHGIQFFVYCWYRAGQNKPVETFLGHAIHDGLFNARYRRKFQFAIMWENQSKGSAGISSEDDLLRYLMPFWIETYFKRPEYLRIDGKPVLFIYRPENLIDDLGSPAAARRAIAKMRDAAVAAGFPGLVILGETRDTNVDALRLMRDEGLDASFAYCWPIQGRPTDAQAIERQMAFWKAWRNAAVLPSVMTLSMGWDSTPWYFADSYWHLSESGFRELGMRVRRTMESLPTGDIGRRMALLDNWNEFGEGHYIAPHREMGFGYLDAVRAAFTSAPAAHTDLAPEDVGLGPYDRAFSQVQRLQAECARRFPRPAGMPGLMARWTFEEPDDAPVVYDRSGGALGAVIDGRRTAGPTGRALVGSGGSATVAGGVARFGQRMLSVDCWVRTDTPDQEDHWFANCVFGDGSSGFRFGLYGGRLCWAIPISPWSHHLRATERLPLGRWVHVAGTFDGRTLRVYQDGREVGSIARQGPVRATSFPLCLGSYDRRHRAAFDGLLGEVRIWKRALGADEIARMAAGGAK